jgi:arylformamidase
MELHGKSMRTIFLSHILSEETPLYGGQGEIRIIADKSIANGDSCNTSIIQMPAHCGTHVDAPYHFDKEGKCIAELSPDEWVFSVVSCLEFTPQPGDLIRPEHISQESVIAPGTEFVLFKTGFEAYRDQEMYWRSAPGIAPEMAEF